MNPDQLNQYRDLLKAGKFDPDRQNVDYAYQRGVNSGIEFAEEQLAKVLKEEETKNDA